NLSSSLIKSVQFIIAIYDSIKDDEMNKKIFSLDGNQLKTIAVIFMIFDHVNTYLFNPRR
uniref:hypothetical protein n=1 Tax=Lactobacillus gallinarum TaxID=52242 RepID=UPI0024B0CFFD